MYANRTVRRFIENLQDSVRVMARAHAVLPLERGGKKVKELANVIETVRLGKNRAEPIRLISDVVQAEFVVKLLNPGQLPIPFDFYRIQRF